MQIKTYNIVYKTHGYIIRWDLTNDGSGGVGVPPPEVVFVNKRWIFMRQNTVTILCIYTRAVSRQPVAKKVEV